ncbi:tyrosine-type recombinase/integrase [Calidithermus roseus]|uniref:Tyrosine recombinase XerC n=1 Tax=Calidithermus roseus TaxID=1644118 RepID=A0A399E9S5_9DEIN|nr:site-specific integrase [Calidithermus roseus]RIH81477.1 Tyrosine recombinase XerC [Calidithermus roseus]
MGTRPGLDHPEGLLAAYERYLLLEKGHSPRGVRRYLYDLRLWLAFLEASGLPPGPPAVRRLMEERALRPRRAQGVLAAIRGYYRWQREVLGQAVEDPTAPVARPRAGRRLARYPSREEIARLLEATRSEREERLLSTLIRFLYGSGLRLSEALSLRVEGLVWEALELYLEPPLPNPLPLLRKVEVELGVA